MDDSGDLNPWMYTAMLTGRGELGDGRAWAVEYFDRVIPNLDDLSPQDIKNESENINRDNARVREWMGPTP
jgi:hypothetical protein